MKHSSDAHFTAPLLARGTNIVQLKELRPKHHAIMDFLLANPRESYSRVAAHFNVSPSWLSTVINSDIFQARLAQRRALMDQALNHNLTDRLSTIAEKSLGSLEDALEDEAVSVNTQLDIAKLSLQALGFLGKPASSPTVVVNNNTQNNTISVADDAIQRAHTRIKDAATAHGLLLEPPENGN